jgi:hypothetical protein
LSANLPRFAANMAFIQAAAGLRAQLVQAGVPTLYLKGSAFLDTLYPDLGERRMSDIDLLVPTDGRDRAHNVLLESGYARLDPPRHRRYSFARHYNWGYVSRQTLSPMVELHVGFCNPERYCIDYQGVWERAVTYHAKARRVPTLSPEDSLLYAAIHAAKHHFEVLPSWVEDVRRIIRGWRPDWTLVLELARAWRARTPLWLMLRLASVDGDTAPSEALEILRPGYRRETLLQAFFGHTRFGRLRIGTNARMPQLLIAALTSDSLSDTFSFVSRYGLRRLRDAWPFVS